MLNHLRNSCFFILLFFLFISSIFIFSPSSESLIGFNYRTFLIGSIIGFLLKLKYLGRPAILGHRFHIPKLSEYELKLQQVTLELQKLWLLVLIFTPIAIVEIKWVVDTYYEPVIPGVNNTLGSLIMGLLIVAFIIEGVRNLQIYLSLNKLYVKKGYQNRGSI